MCVEYNCGMNRRQFGGAVAAALAAPWGTKAEGVEIPGERLREHLETYSTFGRPVGGTFADGVTRVGFSDADVQGREWLKARMKEAGLAVRTDAAGNLFGRREGSDAAAKPVLFGSHIDSVPQGGNFDGPLGVMAALTLLEAVARAGVRTKRPLEMVAWTSEEGVAFNKGLFGSTAATIGLKAAELEERWEGQTLARAIRKVGGDPLKVTQPTIRKGDYAAYVELHIEQSQRLERAGAAIGIVEGIVAIVRYPVVIRGMANHAGTTAMADRQDALVAASDLVLEVNRIAKERSGNQVATVGVLKVDPGAPNVVPGRVDLMIEMRDMDKGTLDGMTRELMTSRAAIEQRRKVKIEIEPAPTRDGVACAPGIQKLIGDAAAKRGWKTMRVPSGAGHDASNLGPICPMGMIFVPSIAGISHNPRELTSWEDCQRGAQVLADTVLELAAS